MEVIYLPLGEPATPEADCIRIQELPDGKFTLRGTVLLACGDSDTDEVVSLIGGDFYDGHDAAEAAGLAWASEHCVARLHVSRSNGAEPLPDSAGGEAPIS